MRRGRGRVGFTGNHRRPLFAVALAVTFIALVFASVAAAGTLHLLEHA